ncbi:LysR family transcriptional regulator [Mesorhizobium sp.]|uniref:LysR family transcriptional regulator n=2 Tax=unclassified Mesorhizobium TaxID=325217 RepID=UPI0025C1A75D|nr:LysR family transcriptional regulator [Mesorhizobium sp.]
MGDLGCFKGTGPGSQRSNHGRSLNCHSVHLVQSAPMKISGSDLHLFRVFESVVRNGGMSAAQMELSLSQPTVSNHLTALEQRLGVKLCERGRRGFSLTEEGRRVYEISTEITGMLEAGSARLSRVRSALAGKVGVGIVDCLTTDPSFRLADAITELSKAAPEVELDLRIMRPNDITKAVAENEIDIGIGGSDIKVASVQYQVIYQEEHAVFCGSTHPLFCRNDETITSAECYGHPWVERGYWYGIRRHGFDAAVANRVAFDIEAQLLMVLSGAYLGVLPIHFARVFEQQGRLRRLPIADEAYSADIEIATRTGEQAANVAYVRDAIIRAHRMHL